VSFDSRDQANRLFKAPVRTRPTLAPVHFSVQASSSKIPEFLVSHEPAFVGCLASVKALCTRTKLPALKTLKYVYRDASLTEFHAPRMGLANSLLFHFLLILALIYIPLAFPTKAPMLDAAFLPPEVIYYPVPARHSTSALPRIAPRGPGGHPGSGFRPNEPPASGRTVSNGNLTAISKPLHPDNFHQTIIQPASPPEIRIPNDLKLPNISLGTVAAPKKPTPSFDLHFKTPTKENSNVVAEMATPLTETSPDFSSLTTLQPINAHPKLPIPLGPLAKPTHNDIGNDDGAGSEAPEIGAPGNRRPVLVIGVDPSGSGSELVLPPGNRSGDFSVAPGKGTSGSPGGGPSGVAGGGNGGKGGAGDLSAGLGPGREGGGGGNDGMLGTVSIRGASNNTTDIAKIDSRLVANLVYPVPSALGVKFPKNRMVVSAGPIGGGGLSIYGALPCAKIYTIFLPMNDTSWTMQYCQRSSPSPEVSKTDTPATVIRLEAGLVPPDPDLDSRFDFKRVEVPPGKGNKLIVLRGTLSEDGTVNALEVYQGLVPQMDEAARLAFSRWKFKPAMRAGKPVAVELLVGIPPEISSGGQSQ
jgi:hypothetical protein